jgi:hypothetical protein
VIGTRIMRIRRRVLQTPVLRFRDPTCGRTVTVIAVAHVGKARYYQHIHDLACELESDGAVVQYEMGRTASEEEWATATDEERAARDAHNARIQEQPGPQLFAAIQEYLQWEDQGSLAIPASWQNTDISSLEYVHMVGPAALTAAEDASIRGLAPLGDAGLARIGGPAAVIIFRLLALDRFERITRFVNRDAHDRAVYAVSVGARNSKALQALPAGGDSVMIWGAAHLPGLRAGLETAGFTRLGRAAWLDVGTLPGVGKCVRDIWAGVQEVKADPVARNREPAETRRS